MGSPELQEVNRRRLEEEAESTKKTRLQDERSQKSAKSLKPGRKPLRKGYLRSAVGACRLVKWGWSNGSGLAKARVERGCPLSTPSGAIFVSISSRGRCDKRGPGVSPVLQ